MITASDTVNAIAHVIFIERFLSESRMRLKIKKWVHEHESAIEDDAPAMKRLRGLQARMQLKNRVVALSFSEDDDGNADDSDE